jgi:hypothetical protein
VEAEAVMFFVHNRRFMDALLMWGVVVVAVVVGSSTTH